MKAVVITSEIVEARNLSKITDKSEDSGYLKVAKEILKPDSVSTTGAGYVQQLGIRRDKLPVLGCGKA